MDNVWKVNERSKIVAIRFFMKLKYLLKDKFYSFKIRNFTFYYNSRDNLCKL